jgi:hypothetical protein
MKKLSEKPKTFLFRFSLVVILSVILLTSCNSQQNIYLIESGAAALDKQPSWVDDDKIIFGSYKNIALYGQRGVTSQQLDVGLYVWDVKNNKVNRYADSKPFVCFDRGYISYHLNKEITDKEKQRGIIGFAKRGIFLHEELEPLFKAPDSYRENYVANTYSCKIVRKPTALRDKHFTMLREGHGYIYVGPAKGKVSLDNRRVELVNDKNNIRKTLDIRRHDYSKPQAFYEFKRAYFIWKILNVSGQWKAGECRHAWWIFPNGRTEAVCIPAMKEFGTSAVRVHPIKTGYLLLSNHHRSTTNAGNAGIYIYDGINKPKRIVKGLIGKVAISSDGCRVAFVSAKSHSDVPLGNRTINVVEVCSITE